MKPVRFLSQFASLLFSLWFACAAVLAADEPKKEFTNATVIALVKANLPADTIVLAIEGNPGKFDISSDALIELQKSGAPQKVLDAIIRKASGTASVPQAAKEIGTPSAPSPFASGGMPNMMGTAWLINGTNRVQMKQTVSTPGTKPRFHPLKAMLGQAALDMVEMFPGSRAALRIQNGSPVFEFGVFGNMQASQVVKLYSVKVESDRRELRVSKDATIKRGLLTESVVPITLKELKTESGFGPPMATYRAEPSSPLKAGEYVLAVSGLQYDFGVD